MLVSYILLFFCLVFCQEAVINFSAGFSAVYRVNCAIYHCAKFYRWDEKLILDWMSRFHRLAHDYERLPETLAGLHFLAFVSVMLKNVAEALA